MFITNNGKKLEAIIQKAIEDLEITQAEYDEIINTASADYHVDPHEEVLLQEFHNLIASGIIKRVR